MKHLFTLILSSLLGCACVMAAPPELKRAQGLAAQGDYKGARAQYQAALQSSFSKSENDIKAIKAGIALCDRKLKEEQRKIDPVNPRPQQQRERPAQPAQPAAPAAPSLAVNGSSTNPTISLAGEGGHKKITISTNQGEPYVYNVPDWMIVTDISDTSMTLLWDPNTSPKKREDSFNITAGSKTLKVNVSQTGGKSNYLQVTGAQFANTRGEAILTEFGEPLYADEMRFLTPDLKYNGPADYEVHTVNVKVINPNGTLRTTPYSPEGYTYKSQIEFDPGWDQAVYLNGVGRGDCSTFEAGLYRVEIYIDDDFTYASNVYINAKDGHTSYLTFDDSPVGDSFFNSYSHSNAHTIRTDGDWTTMDLPTWCRATRQGNRLTLTVEDNESSFAREGYMTIKAGDRTMRVALHQAGR